MPYYLMGSQEDRLECRINDIVDEAKQLPWHFLHGVSRRKYAHFARRMKILIREY